MAKWFKAPNSSSGAFDQICVGQMPNRHGTQGFLSKILNPLDGTLACTVQVQCTRVGSARKITQNTYRGRVGGYPGVSCVHNKYSYQMFPQAYDQQ